jgi:hypothetical protein
MNFFLLEYLKIQMNKSAEIFNLPSNELIFSTNLTSSTDEEISDSDQVK